MGILVKDIQKRWPLGCIPYVTTTLTDEEVNTLNRALREFEEKTKIRFIERTMQSRYVLFRPDWNPMDGICSSDTIGMGWGITNIRLDPNFSRRTAIHEIGHALGLIHEHKRPDRDNHIDVNEAEIRIEHIFQFSKEDTANVIQVGPYDLDSVMHYGRARSMSRDGNTPLITTDDPNLNDRIGRGRSLSQTDIRSIERMYDGNMHVYRLSSDGQIETTIQTSSWQRPIRDLASYTLDFRNFVLVLEGPGASLVFCAVAGDGSPDNVIAGPTSLGRRTRWTTALVYPVGLSTYLLAYNSGNGHMRIHNIDASGGLGSEVARSGDFSEGFTSIVHYRAGLVGDYVIMVNAVTRRFEIYNVQYNGQIGERKQTGRFDRSCNIVKAYQADNKPYLFRLSTTTGAFMVTRIRDDGTLGNDIQESSYTAGWTTAIPYSVGSENYLFLMKAETGDVKIRRIRRDGQIGRATDIRRTGMGWNVATIYGAGSGKHLLLVRQPRR